jgi:hypothetical protein
MTLSLLNSIKKGLSHEVWHGFARKRYCCND